MYHTIPVTDDLVYLGGNDRKLSLFESAYPVPRGMSYNSYLLLGETTVLFDTADAAIADRFLENLKHALGGRELDYLVVHHMEPDHAASVLQVVSRHPAVTLLASRNAAVMLKNYFGYSQNVRVVSDGETISLGERTLTFLMTPMVHWPEVMMSFLSGENVLFSADAFGTFGALGGSIFADECDFFGEYLGEARRYYFNIVGKYGAQVQNALKKASGLPIRTVCPLHGPVWRRDFQKFLSLYDTWSGYRPEEKGVVLFYASVYGHTQNAAEILAGELAARGVFTKVYDVSSLHVSYLLSEAFRYSHAVFLSTTYSNEIFPSMESFLKHLKDHGYQGRGYALAENGSWSPQAGALMEKILSECKGMTKLGQTVRILSAVDETNRSQIGALADEIAAHYHE